MLSAFISKSSSATTVGFFVFLVGFVTQVRFSMDQVGFFELHNLLLIINISAAWSIKWVSLCQEIFSND